MKKSPKKQIANLPSNIQQEAAVLLAENNYKKALEYYKMLFKQAPCNAYRDAIRDCYIGRVRELSKKGMYREAVMLWENHSEYCFPCHHIYLYIHLLITVGLENKAGVIFLQNKNSLEDDQVSTLEEIFAALLLKGSSALIDIFPEESLLKKHLIFANQALVALSQRDGDKVELILTNISFRSPYKQLRLVLKGYLLLLCNKIEEAFALIKRVPLNSPFYPLAHIAQLTQASPLAQVKALSHFSQMEFNCFSALKGWTTSQQKHLDKLRQLPEKSNPRILLDLVVHSMPYVNRSTARRLCYNLLPFYEPGLKTFEKVFGVLSPEEKTHLKALGSIDHKRHSPTKVWLEYEETLASYASQTLTISLKQALALRQAASFGGEYAEEESTSIKKRIILFEKSLDLDPLDKPIYLEVIQYYRKHGPKKICGAYIDKALKVFPNDRDILITAIESIRYSKLPSRVIALSKKLLELDPLNAQAKIYLTEVQVLQAQRCMLQKKWDQADLTLKAIKADTTHHWNLVVRLNQGLCAYMQGKISEAHSLIQQCGENDIIVRLQLYIEADKLQLPSSSLEKDLTLVPANKLVITDSVQLLQLVKTIDQYDVPIKWKNILSHITKPLQKSTQCVLKVDELVKICECFTRIQQFDFVQNFIKKQHRIIKDVPLLVYYSVNAKIKGNAKKMRSIDYHLLTNALDKAQDMDDIRTVSLIGQLLSAAEEESDHLFPIDLSGDILEEMLEMLKPRKI